MPVTTSRQVYRMPPGVSRALLPCARLWEGGHYPCCMGGRWVMSGYWGKGRVAGLCRKIHSEDESGQGTLRVGYGVNTGIKTRRSTATPAPQSMPTTEVTGDKGKLTASVGGGCPGPTTRETHHRRRVKQSGLAFGPEPKGGPLELWQSPHPPPPAPTRLHVRSQRGQDSAPRTLTHTHGPEGTPGGLGPGHTSEAPKQGQALCCRRAVG